MKKVIMAAAVLSMVICFSGCGANESSSETLNAETTVSESVETTVPETAETTAVESAESKQAAVDFTEITGTWHYQKMDAETQSVFLDFATVEVKADGSFTYQPDDGSAAKSGKITIKSDDFADGTSMPFFSFEEADGTPLFGCYCGPEDPNYYYIGNGGIERLSRASDAVATGSDSNSNNDNTDSTGSAETFSVQEIVGRWYYQEADPVNYTDFNNIGYVIVKEDGTFNYQPDDGSAAKSGSIEIKYDEFEDGNRLPYFSFAEADGTFWIGCYCDSEESGIYYIGNGGMARLVRDIGNAAAGNHAEESESVTEAVEN